MRKDSLEKGGSKQGELIDWSVFNIKLVLFHYEKNLTNNKSHK